MRSKTIPSYEHLIIYEDGRIQNILTQEFLHERDRGGYRKVDLYNLHGIRPKLVHRLLAEAFIPNPDNKSQVNHIDGNRTNNSLDNLEWVTASENAKHAWKIGLSKGSEKQKEAARQTGLKNGKLPATDKVIAAAKITGSKIGADNGKKRAKLVNWTHPEHGTHYCSAPDLVKMFSEQNLFQALLHNVYSGKYKQHKGWSIITS